MEIIQYSEKIYVLGKHEASQILALAFTSYVVSGTLLSLGFLIWKWKTAAVIVDNVHSNIQPNLALKYCSFVISPLKQLNILHQTPIVVKL